jgi:Prophage tail length tape measure protein
VADNRFYFYMGVKNEGLHAAFDQATKDQERYNEAAKKSEGGDFSRVRAGAAAASRSIKAVGDSMALTRNEALTLNYTINDVVASLASGASPMTVLLQQGPQVQQVFGSLSNFINKLIPGLIRFAPAIAAIGVAFAGLRGISIGSTAGQDFNELRLKAGQAGVSIKDLQETLAQGAGENVNMDKIFAGYERMKDGALAARQAQKDLMDERDKAIKGLGQLNTTAPDFSSKIEKINEQFKGKDIFSKLKISLADFKGSQEEVEQLALRVSGAIDRVGGAYKRAELEREAKQAFGEDYLRVLRNASSETEAFGRVYRNFLRDFDPDQAANSAKSQQTAADRLALLRQKVSDATSTIFIPAAQAKDDFMTRFLLKNEKSIQSYVTFLQGISSQIQDFFAILQGDRAAQSRNPITTELVKGVNEVIRIFGVAKDSLASFYESLGGSEKIGSLFTTMAKTISAAFQITYAAIDKFTKAINEVFGTNIPAETMIAGYAILRLVSPLKTVGGLLVAMGQTNPFVLIAEGAVLLAMYSDRIEATLTSLGLTLLDSVVGGLREAYLWARMIYQTSHADWSGASDTNKQLDALEKARKEVQADQKKWANKGSDFDNMDFGEAFKARWDKTLGKFAPGLKNAVQNIFDVDVEKIWNDFGKFGTQQLDQVGKKADQTAERIRRVSSAFEDRSESKFAKFVSPPANNNRPAAGGAFDDRSESKFARFSSVPGQTSTLAQPYKEGTAAAKEYVAASQAARGELAAVTVRTPKTLADGISGGVYKDKPGREGIDNALYPNMKLTIDQIEKPIKLKVETQAVDEANQKLQATKKTIDEVEAKKTTEAKPASTPPVSPAEQLAKDLSSVQQLTQQAMSSVGGFGVSVLQQVQAVAEGVRKTLQELTAAASSLTNAMPSATPSGTIPKMATGGLVRGPGTSKSDSVLAWLSNGEFVMSAAAVNNIGLGVLSGMNAGLLHAPGFADGGLVGGGYVPSDIISSSSSSSKGGNITIVLDNKPHGPFSGSTNDIDALSRTAVAKRAARTARTSSRVG